MKSIYRELEYKELSKIRIDGKILDLGGCKKSGYGNLIKGRNLIDVANISKQYGYDIKVDLEKKFPIKNNTYKAVLCINTLEHIYNYENVIKESYRVLEKGGKLILATPFMYRVHSCPNDYFRYTDDCLYKVLNDTGFRSITIFNIGNGIFSIFYQNMPYFIFSFFVNIDRLLCRLSNKYLIYSDSLPLGYITIGVK